MTTAWDRAKNEAKNVLGVRARVRGQITYSDLCQRIQAVQFEPHGSEFARFLGELSQDSWNEGRYMISSIVVHKYGDQEPGGGFYDYAAQLGLNTTDRLRCWIEEVKKTHAFWAP